MNILYKRSTFSLLRNRAPRNAAVFVRSFAIKNRKGRLVTLFDTFATHAGLVHDVTDNDCSAQNGSFHGRVFATFSCLIQFSKQDEKPSEKNAARIYHIHSFRIAFWIQCAVVG